MNSLTTRDSESVFSVPSRTEARLSAIVTISFRNSSASSQRAGIASTPYSAPQMFPVIAPVLSLSPE
jgi:hypothetical protein